METTVFVNQPLRLGCWRRETERFRRRGTKGAAGSSGATKPSSQRKAPGNCLALQPERARAQQSEQHGRRGTWRRGAERVLVPAASGFGRNLREFATWLKWEWFFSASAPMK